MPLLDEYALLLRAAHGLTFTLQESDILGERYLKLRPWLQRIQFFRELLECPFCTSFWTGMLVYALWRPRGFRLRRIPLFGFAAASYAYETEQRLTALEDQAMAPPNNRHSTAE